MEKEKDCQAITVFRQQATQGQDDLMEMTYHRGPRQEEEECSMRRLRDTEFTRMEDAGVASIVITEVRDTVMPVENESGNTFYDTQNKECFGHRERLTLRWQDEQGWEKMERTDPRR